MIYLLLHVEHIKRNLENGQRNRESIAMGVKIDSVSQRQLIKSNDLRLLWDELAAGTKSVNYFLSRISYLIHKRAPKFEVPSDDELTDDVDDDDFGGLLHILIIMSLLSKMKETKKLCFSLTKYNAYFLFSLYSLILLSIALLSSKFPEFLLVTDNYCAK